MDFSVVIPVHNGEAHLAATLESVCGQTLPPREVLVVDDGSTDASARIAREFGRTVRCLATCADRGVQAARNLGMASAAGSHIALCDHDDLWAPGYLEAHARLLRAEPEIDLIFANFRLLHGETPDAVTKFDQAPTGWWEECGRRVREEGWVFDHPIAGQTFRWHPVFVSGLVLARELVQQAGGYDTRLRGMRGEDGEFTLRCLYRARRVGALPEPLWLYRRHATNFSRSQMLVLVDEIAILARIRETHEEAHPWHAIIDDEIRKRRIQAFDAAFGEAEHDLARRLLRDIAPADRTGRMRMKAACLALPDVLGKRMNAVLQRLS